MKAPTAMKPLVPVLVALLLTGCYAAPTTPAFVPVDAAVPASAGLHAKVSSQATLSTASCPGPVSVVSGMVFDQDHQPIKEGATVQVTSMDPDVPFHAKVAVIGGAYVVSQAPLGVPLEIKATNRTGFSRVRALELNGQAGCADAEALKASINFGGPANGADASGNLYYLPR
jgi:hypothetical protein